MTDNRNTSAGIGGCNNRDTICIDTMRVLDACKDRDCFEDVRVYFNAYGQEILNNANTARVKRAEIACAHVSVSPIAFNDGFYQINVRYYIGLEVDTCSMNTAGRGQDIHGVAVIDKSVVLFGGKGNANIYTSDPNNTATCPVCDCSNVSTNLPVGVVEAVDPIVLSAKLVQAPCPCNCACSCSDIPASVANSIGGDLVDPDDGNRLLVTLGLFSIVRIERPGQYLINATNYAVPDKECISSSEDPCSLFRNMSFPTNEFAPECFRPTQNLNDVNSNTNGCGCRRQNGN